MKYLTLESFINSLSEEELWKIIDEYERWYDEYISTEKSILWKKTKEYCSMNEILPYDTRIVAMGAYRYFALKYKETLK